MENIILKRLSSNDWERFKAIRLKGFETDAKAFGPSLETESTGDQSYWQNRIENEERFYYVAENSKKIIATAGAKKITEDNWMIIAVYTLPEFRGKKISQELICKVEGDLKQKGISAACLMVNVEQKQAISLYEKLGYKVVKTEKDQKMGDGKIYDEYYMEKELI